MYLLNKKAIYLNFRSASPSPHAEQNSSRSVISLSRCTLGELRVDFLVPPLPFEGPRGAEGPDRDMIVLGGTSKIWTRFNGSCAERYAVRLVDRKHGDLEARSRGGTGMHQGGRIALA